MMRGEKGKNKTAAAAAAAAAKLESSNQMYLSSSRLGQFSPSTYNFVY